MSHYRRFALFLLLIACAICPGTLRAQSITPEFIDANREHLERLFEALDPAHEELASLQEEWAAGKHLSAAKSLAQWYEKKTFPLRILEPIRYPPDLKERADAALLNHFFLIDSIMRVPSREGGGLDWSWRGEGNDKERAWMLNRHEMLPDLAEAYRRTNRDLYRTKLNDLLQDWILANPYPDKLTFSESWRALEVARRILNVWVHLFYQRDILNRQSRLLMLASVVHHADALREHASFWGGNHLITEKLALLTLATAWPEFASAREWREYAIARIEEQYFKQTYPDGSYKELSNHYQRVVLVNAQNFLRLLAHAVPDWRKRPIVTRVERMWNFFAWSIQPDGSGPLSNASDREVNSAFVSEVVDFFNRPDWRFSCTNGEKGKRPTAPPSRLFPWAGQAFLRSGWDRKAHWVYFDAGPYGTGHQHVDHLHVSATFNGKPLLSDSGRYTYQPGPWRDYFKGPDGHNTVKLDGAAAEQPPREVSSPLPIGFEDHPDYAIAWARTAFRINASGPFPSPFPRLVPWTRIVFLNKKGSLLIIDHLRTFRTSQFEADWHFHAEVSEEAARKSLQTEGAASSLSLSAEIGSPAPDVNGFYSPEYGVRLPAPALSFTGTLRQPSSFLWHFQDPLESAFSAELLSDPTDPVLTIRIRGSESASAVLVLRVHPTVEVLSFEWEKLLAE